jgi:hypothetical protein
LPAVTEVLSSDYFVEVGRRLLQAITENAAAARIAPQAYQTWSGTPNTVTDCTTHIGLMVESMSLENSSFRVFVQMSRDDFSPSEAVD